MRFTLTELVPRSVQLVKKQLTATARIVALGDALMVIAPEESGVNVRFG